MDFRRPHPYSDRPLERFPCDLKIHPLRGAFARVYSGERRGFDSPRHWRITYPAAMIRDAIIDEKLIAAGKTPLEISFLLLAS